MSDADKIGALNLGQAKKVLQAKKGSPLEELLKTLCQDVSDQLVESLDSHGVKASLNLRQSIKPDSQVTINGSEVTIGINADFYWKFVNYGVNGSEVGHGAPDWGTQPAQEKSFHQAILDWIPYTGTTLPDGFSSYDSFAWAIQTNIAKKGKEARPFYTDVVNDELVEYLRKPISDLLGRSIQINIVDPWL